MSRRLKPRYFREAWRKQRRDEAASWFWVWVFVFIAIGIALFGG